MGPLTPCLSVLFFTPTECQLPCYLKQCISQTVSPTAASEQQKCTK
jgi:hypothetical protein